MIPKFSSGSIVRFCLIGIPLGLILLGVASLAWTFSRGNASAASPANAEGNAALRQARNAAARGGEAPAQADLAQILRRHVETLSVRIGPRHSGNFPKLEAAKFYIESTLGPQNMGYAIREQNYEVKDDVFTNVEVELTGTQRPEEIIVVGAHYDTVPGTPGADDNASGVAAVLALAGAFHGQPQRRTLRFVAFANEEPPWFQTADMGSLRYAQELHGKNAKVVAMLSLESIGYFVDAPGSQHYPPPFSVMYPSVGNFIAVVGNLDSRKLVDKVHAAMADAAHIPVEKGAFPALTPGVGWSDHWSFWQYGYPAVMLTGTAPYRNPNYHLKSDQTGTLDYNRFAATVLSIRQALLRLANDR